MRSSCRRRSRRPMDTPPCSTSVSKSTDAGEAGPGGAAPTITGRGRLDGERPAEGASHGEWCLPVPVEVLGKVGNLGFGRGEGFQRIGEVGGVGRGERGGVADGGAPGA